MNNQEVTERKLKFPVGALFLVLAVVFYILINLRNIPFWGMSRWADCALLIATTVIFFMKKRGIFAIVPLGILALLYFSFTFSGISDFIFIASIILLALCDMNIKVLVKFKKIFLILLYVGFAASSILSFFIFTVDMGVLFTLMGGIKVLLINFSLLLIGLWLANPYKKEPKPNDIDTNDYYVSIGKHVCLLFFTCGVWLYIWTYRMTKYTNSVSNEYRSPAKMLWLCMLVPFYMIIWTYKTALMIDAAAKEKGVSSELATPCLILAIFVGIVPPILIQEKVNTLVENK